VADAREVPMKFELIRPWLFRLAGLLRLQRAHVEVGRRCRFERACSIKMGKRSSLRLGDKTTLRGGCVIDLAREGSLTLAEQAEIRHYAIIECAGQVMIGRRSVIGAYNWLQGSGGIEIGDDVIIGPGVRIISSTHDISDPDRPFASQPLICGTVRIGSNVWIGADVVILTGVSIGKNVVVGAGSLVTRDLPDGAVYVGTPAGRVKDLQSNL
jgi:acetyltransferase-like isoleucine patch superfamily enzyme